MSDTLQTPPPPQGAPPPPSPRVFASLDAKNAKFVYSRGKDAPEESTTFITGYLLASWLEWDPGRDGQRAQDRIPARWELCLDIKSRFFYDQNGELPEYSQWKIDLGAGSTVYSTICGILQVPKETPFIGITLVSLGDATVANIAIWNGSTWSHVFPPPSGDTPVEERHHRAFCDLQDHWSWNKPVEFKRRKKLDAEPPLPRRATQTQPPSTPPPGQQAPDALPHGGGTAPVSTPAAATGDEPSLFGFTWLKMPGPAHYEQPPTEKLRVAWETAILSAEISDKEAGYLVDTICELVGWDQKQGMPFAIMWLAKEFLLKATEEQVESAILKSTPKAAPEPDAYDPFADE